MPQGSRRWLTSTLGMATMLCTLFTPTLKAHMHMDTHVHAGTLALNRNVDGKQREGACPSE